LYDCVELFLASNLDFPVYWELNLTAKDEMVDRLVMKKPHGWFGLAMPEEDMAGLRHAVRRTANGYTAELAIPWSNLPGMKRVKAGDRLWGLAAWGDVNGQTDFANLKYYSEIPSVGGFNSVWEFQEWRLK
jgi:hypothetical protein